LYVYFDVDAERLFSTVHSIL